MAGPGAADLTGRVMVGLDGPELSSADRARLALPAVGAVCLFARNYTGARQVKELIRQARSCVAKRLLFAVDQEGGRVQRFTGRGFTTLAPPSELGETYERDPKVALQDAMDKGATIARQLRNVDVDLALAPVLDIEHGRNKMLRTRCLARTPEAVTALAMAFSQGLATHGFSAVGKHFPGHGWAQADSHEELPVDSRSRRQISEADMLPYRQLIKHGLLGGVMLSHVHYSKLDASSATYSAKIVGLLRDEVGFAGPVLSDDLVMDAAERGAGIADRVLQAHAAGCDLLLVCGGEPVLFDDELAALPARGASAVWQPLAIRR